MAVNDVFVMKAWGKASAVDDKVLMLADGNADYAKALGLEMDATGFGMGIRGKRFAIVVKDGVAKGVFVEGPGEFKVSSAEYVLGQLWTRQARNAPASSARSSAVAGGAGCANWPGVSRRVRYLRSARRPRRRTAARAG